jgi:hypothetical protein
MKAIDAVIVDLEMYTTSCPTAAGHWHWLSHPHYARRVIERASTAGISDLNKVKLYEQSGVIARQRSDTSRWTIAGDRSGNIESKGRKWFAAKREFADKRHSETVNMSRHRIGIGVHNERNTPIKAATSKC